MDIFMAYGARGISMAYEPRGISMAYGPRGISMVYTTRAPYLYVFPVGRSWTIFLCCSLWSLLFIYWLWKKTLRNVDLCNRLMILVESNYKVPLINISSDSYQ